MAIHSKDGKETGKTKLLRLSERAERDKETVFNNLGHIIDKPLLLQLYQQMQRKKASGIDGINKDTYGEDLESNIDNLLMRIRRGTYHPQPARLTEIPKEDGSKHPLAIACFEDKLVQAAVSEILTCIYEPLFLSCSYGFRREQSCHDALKALTQKSYPCFDGAVVEIDICQYFNSIPHLELKKILRKKIGDERFLNLIDKLATAPTLQHGQVVTNTVGCPQGSILSPILANIFLHEVIDDWFDTIKKSHIKGMAEEVRYADDMVFIFEHYGEAKRFFDVLPKRLQKYGLQMHAEKSRLIQSGQNAAARAHRWGQRLPTYSFLGFTVYWGKARSGTWWRMKFKSRKDRRTAKLKGLKQFLWNNLTAQDTEGLLRYVSSVIRGWVNYHAISDNQRSVRGFVQTCARIIRKWINRRGRRKPMTVEQFYAYEEAINFPRDWSTVSLFQRS